jgi:L-lactate dehydrogenase (cytochrome)
MKDRGFIERLIDRAKAANCSALVITLDLQILGQRHKDLKNGLSAPPKLTLRNLINIAGKPRWAMGMLGTSRRQFGNIVGHVTGVSDMSSLSDWTASQFDPALNWGDVEWIKKRWGGKVILKGIQDPSGRTAGSGQRRRRADRLQPWRTPARRRRILHPCTASHRAGRG